MGGERQFEAPAETKTDTGENVIGNLRIHESNGEVHFHDDNNGLKAAVPTAIMFEAWENLSSDQKKKFNYKDRTNRTEICVRVVNKKAKKKKDNDFRDIKFSIQPLREVTSQQFSQFDNFIKG